MGKSVGIDLETTNSGVAIWENNSATVIPSSISLVPNLMISPTISCSAILNRWNKLWQMPN